MWPFLTFLLAIAVVWHIWKICVLEVWFPMEGAGIVKKLNPVGVIEL